MSNHSGSYMLNEVLYIAKEMGIFNDVGKDEFRKFALELIKLGRKYDCNKGEILMNIGEELGVCYGCLNDTEDIENGLCKDCRS
jgi:hypothetical protein